MNEEFGEAERKRRLCEAIAQEDCSSNIIPLLISNGRALPDECELWDYKENCPDYRKLKGDDQVKKDFKIEEAELIKDCVAFFNAYGGYILFGFSDKGRNATNFEGNFDTDEFKKQIEKYTSGTINVVFREFTLEGGHRCALLLIPKRSYDVLPVQFRRPAPTGGNGRQAFSKDSFYLRREAASRPITKDDDLPFLCVSGRREIAFTIGTQFSESLSNNLPARDPGLIELISRRGYLIELEKWFLDRHLGIKLLTGLGGYGKTAIARSFAEVLVYNRPQQYEALIWLSAKTQFFVSIQGTARSNARVDFSDSVSFFSSALMQLGYLSAEVEAKYKEELINDFIDLIKDLPVVVVVDDIDSLEIGEQYTLIGDLQRVSSVNEYSSKIASKFLITSRLDLGASPAQVLPVAGFERGKGFEEYVRMASASLGLDEKIFSDSFMKKLFGASEGAPTFINAILRLISLGDSPDEAISNWRGRDGEEVRRFAFERELGNLDTASSAVLYSAILLNNPTLTSIESATGVRRAGLRDAISKLRQYHLLVQHYDEGRKVAVVNVPESLRLMADVVRRHLPHASDVERRVSQVNTELRKFSRSRNVGDVISEVVSRWKAGQTSEALEIANEALRQDSKNKDLLSLVGRAYLKVVPPDVSKSEYHLQMAYEQGNSRVETVNDWIMCKQMRRDWRGLIAVANKVRNVIGAGASTFHVAVATAKIAENRMLESKASEAAEKYREAARLARDCLNRHEAEGKTKNLIDLKNLCYELCVNAYARTASAGGGTGAYRVWEAAVEALNAKVRSAGVCNTGLSGLIAWASANREAVSDGEVQDQRAYEAGRIRELLEAERIHVRCLRDARAALALLTAK